MWKNYLVIPYQRNLEILLLGVCLSKGSKNKCLLKDLHKNVPSSGIHENQNMETPMPIERRKDKYILIHLYNMIFTSKQLKKMNYWYTEENGSQVQLNTQCMIPLTGSLRRGNTNLWRQKSENVEWASTRRRHKGSLWSDGIFYILAGRLVTQVYIYFSEFFVHLSFVHFIVHKYWLN